MMNNPAFQQGPPISMKALVEAKFLTENLAIELAWLVSAFVPMVISSDTSSGKTIFLSALSSCIPRAEKIVTIEDSWELKLHPKQNVVSLKSNEKGWGVTGNAVLHNNLYMKPDRIIIGEIKRNTVTSLLEAAGLGHKGYLTTFSSHSANAVIGNIMELVIQSEKYDLNQGLSLLSDGLDLIIHLTQSVDGLRYIESISEIPSKPSLKAGVLSLHPVTIWKSSSIGHYEKINEYSKNFIKRHDLSNKEKLTIEQLYALSS